MTLLARRREELARAAGAEEETSERSFVATRRHPIQRSFLHVQEAIGNEGATRLLAGTAVQTKRRGEATATATHEATAESSGLAEIGPALALVAAYGAARREAAEAARTEDRPIALRSSPTLLVEDDAEASPDQIHRGAFLSAMARAATEAAEQALANTGETARGCPWIAHYLRYYEGQSATRIERDLRRWVPETRSAPGGEEILAAATRHIGESVRHWVETGRLTGVPRSLPGARLAEAMGRPAGDRSRLLRKTRGPATAGPAEASRVQTALGPGRPLAGGTRGRMERAFGTRFGQVRLHTGPTAQRLARDLDARAFAVGQNVAFAHGEYRPGTLIGDALLAHELAHTLQQRRGPVAGSSEARLEAEADLAAVDAVTSLRSGGPVGESFGHPRFGSGLRLQLSKCKRKKKPELKVATEADKMESVEDATRYLEQMAGFVEELAFSATIEINRGELERARSLLDLARVHELLGKAQEVYDAQRELLSPDHQLLRSLRDAYLKVLDEIRKAAPVSLSAAQDLTGTERLEADRLYVGIQTQWLEASPMTSARLADRETFGAADVEAGERHVEVLDAFLDDLLEELPGLKLTDVEREQTYGRLLAGLRRAFITIKPGNDGTLDPETIPDAAIADKYRRVAALLIKKGGFRPRNVITAVLRDYSLPDPIPVPTFPEGTKIDWSQVPANELASVRYGVTEVLRTSFPDTDIKYENTVWPVELVVRSGGDQRKVRYEMIWDKAGNLRVERLGKAEPRGVPQDFAALGFEQKKERLITEFKLTAIENRPASPSSGRLEAEWKKEEIDQVKAAFDLLPPRDRHVVAGHALIREIEMTDEDGKALRGLAHTAHSKHYDEPDPPAQTAPHLHYADSAFAPGGFVGSPESTGPGSEQTLLHEVGHARIHLAHRAANQAVRDANSRITAALADFPSMTGSKNQVNAWDAWNAKQKIANQAIIDYGNSVISDPPSDAATQATKLQAAQQAGADRDKARDRLRKVGLKKKLRLRVEELDAAADDLLRAYQQTVAADRQIPIFNQLASTFGFHPFTSYSRSGGDGELFAETYALYLTDPNRLSLLSRDMFLWFEAGMPMDPAWQPPPEAADGAQPQTPAGTGEGADK